MKSFISKFQESPNQNKHQSIKEITNDNQNTIILAGTKTMTDTYSEHPDQDSSIYTKTSTKEDTDILNNRYNIIPTGHQR